MTMRSRGRHDVFREFSHHILWMVGVCCVNVAVTGSARPSSGCRQAPNAHLTPTYPVGGSNLTIPVTDALGTINRSAYLVFPPHQRDANLPLPVVVAFHGQSGTGPQTGSGHLWDEYAARDGYVMVYPTGMDDADPNEPGGNTGWNVGTNGDTSTCVDPMPDPTYSVCHTSCVTLKQCGRCSWSTCRDDVKFIGELLDHVAATACIDLDAVHISGASNGGMMVHYLGQQMPGRFASINPVFALPLVGYLVGSNSTLITASAAVAGTSVLAIHDRQDTNIPVAGGVSQYGWIYEPLSRVLGVYAAINGCSEEQSPAVNLTAFEGGLSNIVCTEYLTCKAAPARVIQCLYDGSHGVWPDQPLTDELMWWFFTRSHRPDPARRGHTHHVLAQATPTPP
eukprot:m.337360 g.337360  ORF g.337360 m.337360 type:complete len:395 (-) comp16533_c3_seq15:111-1295(-)